MLKLINIEIELSQKIEIMLHGTSKIIDVSYNKQSNKPYVTVLVDEMGEEINRTIGIFEPNSQLSDAISFDDVIYLGSFSIDNDINKFFVFEFINSNNVFL